jgi:hypothetical protein
VGAVEPGSLGDAMQVALGDGQLRTDLARASWAAGQALPLWNDTARIICSVIRQVAALASMVPASGGRPA